MLQRIWCNEFNIDNHCQCSEDIYRRKVKNVPIQKLEEFNYKILTNILDTGNFLSKWKRDISDKCDVCDNVNTAEHMLYDCECAEKLWKQLVSP